MASLQERYEESVDRSGERHVWLGAINDERGTGRLKVAGRNTTASRRPRRPQRHVMKRVYVHRTAHAEAEMTRYIGELLNPSEAETRRRRMEPDPEAQCASAQNGFRRPNRTGLRTFCGRRPIAHHTVIAR